VITKGERSELKSLIRARFKVLRSDVAVRQAELITELDSRIATKFAVADKAWSDAMFLIDEAAKEANRKANDVLRGLDVDGYDRTREYPIVQTRPITKPTGDRHSLRQQGLGRIEATVRAAYLKLDRQENDLLTRLITGALESSEAQAFLGEIPTIASLVPSDRLLELEQSLRGESS
jgi:hypothetical protein